MQASIRLPVLCNKKGSSRPVSFRINLLFLQGIPTLALSKSGSRSKVTPSSQPVIQAPVCLIFINMVIHHYEGNYNLVYRKNFHSNHLIHFAKIKCIFECLSKECFSFSINLQVALYVPGTANVSSDIKLMKSFTLPSYFSAKSSDISSFSSSE